MQIAASKWKVAVLSVFPALASAQADSARIGAVGGTVFDSVKMKVVAGASVQLVLKSAPNGTIYSGESDARGRYEISSVPAGYYLISFMHPALDSFTVAPPVRTVDVMRGNRSVADLFVPSPKRIIAALCSSEANDTLGVLFGVLRDARTQTPVESGAVLGSWNDLIITRVGSRVETARVRATVGADGLFAMCGLAPSSEVVVVGAAGDDSTGAILLTLPENGLLRRDLLIGGRARLSGVVTINGRPKLDARVSIGAQERWTDTDSSGRFRLEVQAGTQTLEVKAIGYVPERFPIDITAGHDTTVTVALTSLKKMMDTIKVMAERLYWADRGGFTERKRQGIGHFIDEKDIAKHATFDVLDALRRAPGLSVVGFGFFKKVVMRKNDGTACNPSLFIDGFRMMLGPADLDMVRPNEIGGIEIYRSSGQSPVQFQNLDGCGSIVLWTRPPRPTKIR
jgi:hypothetical protein